MKGKFFPFSNVSFCLIKLQIKLSTSNLAAFNQQPGSFQPATYGFHRKFPNKEIFSFLGANFEEISCETQFQGLIWGLIWGSSFCSSPETGRKLTWRQKSRKSFIVWRESTFSLLIFHIWIYIGGKLEYSLNLQYMFKYSHDAPYVASYHRIRSKYSFPNDFRKNRAKIVKESQISHHHQIMMMIISYEIQQKPGFPSSLLD